MSRVQLALNVSDLEASVAFYTNLFGTQPHKRRPGYANFAIEEPPLKLVLIETTEDARGHGTAGALNHLGVEIESSDAVRAGADRLAAAGLATFEESDTTCCYALQDKVWVQDPAGAPWELYVVKDDDPTQTQGPGGSLELLSSNAGACCTPESGFAVEGAGSAACC